MKEPERLSREHRTAPSGVEEVTGDRSRRERGADRKKKEEEQ